MYGQWEFLLLWVLQWLLNCTQWEENLFDRDSVFYVVLNLDILMVKEVNVVTVKISAHF